MIGSKKEWKIRACRKTMGSWPMINGLFDFAHEPMRQLMEGAGIGLLLFFSWWDACFRQNDVFELSVHACSQQYYSTVHVYTRVKQTNSSNFFPICETRATTALVAGKYCILFMDCLIDWSTKAITTVVKKRAKTETNKKGIEILIILVIIVSLFLINRLI